MILGIGTDLVKISRIEKSILRNGQALAKRVLTQSEMAVFESSASPAAYLAKRFAAKEAASKALGTGIGKISWQDLEVTNNEAGAPAIHCYGSALTLCQTLGVKRLSLSLSDEDDLALAFVVLSG